MKLIVNADDFGRSHQINCAIIRAHREGVLTSVSLMIAGAAADEAVSLAHDHPSLAVGLHVVVVEGPAVLPPRLLPHLLDASGRFPGAPVGLGLRYALSKRARGELAAELRAQFEAFAVTGLPLSHVDGHQHMHMHPTVFDLVLPLAREFGARGIRVVRDDLPLAIAHRPRGRAKLAVQSLVFATLARRCRRACQRNGLAFAERTYGFLHSGRMDERYTRAALRRCRDETVEMYFHPTEGPRLDALGPNPDDLAALLSADVRHDIESCGFVLSRYADLAPAWGAHERRAVPPLTSHDKAGALTA